MGRGETVQKRVSVARHADPVAVAHKANRSPFSWKVPTPTERERLRGGQDNSSSATPWSRSVR